MFPTCLYVLHSAFSTLYHFSLSVWGPLTQVSPVSVSILNTTGAWLLSHFWSVTTRRHRSTVCRSHATRVGSSRVKSNILGQMFIILGSEPCGKGDIYTGSSFHLFQDLGPLPVGKWQVALADTPIIDLDFAIQFPDIARRHHNWATSSAFWQPLPNTIDWSLTVIDPPTHAFIIGVGCGIQNWNVM